MTFVFINCTAETFTPTRSGGICSWVWGLAQTAQKEGVEPWIITKTSPDKPYEWPKTVLVDYPRMPKNRVLSKLLYVQRDLTGWGHVRQKAYKPQDSGRDPASWPGRAAVTSQQRHRVGRLPAP